MPEHRYTSVQIFIICVLIFAVGMKIQRQYPEWFNGVGRNSNFNSDLVPGGSSDNGAGRFITLGSATSTQDSGFLAYVIPIFRAATGMNVHVEAVGSDRALSIGARGNVDALLVHDRAGEERFVADGYGVDRRDVMHNDFIIVGPRADPAGIRNLNDARAAFALIAENGALFVSRGDDGGTFIVERRLWREAGIDPSEQPWYRNLGEGVGATLNFAAAVNAYTIADRATWSNLKNKQSLEILIQGDPCYSIPTAASLSIRPNGPA